MLDKCYNCQTHVFAIPGRRGTLIIDDRILFRVKFPNIIVMKSDGEEISSVSDSKVVVDHVSDLFFREPILFLSFQTLPTGFFLEVGILDDVVQNRCNSASNVTKFEN